MDDDDGYFTDGRPSATRILQCLRMLAEEADHLPLPRTYLALQKAIRACEAERSRPNPMVRARPRRNLVLH